MKSSIAKDYLVTSKTYCTSKIAIHCYTGRAKITKITMIAKKEDTTVVTKSQCHLVCFLILAELS